MKTAILGANGYIARNMIRVNSDGRYGQMALYGHQLTHIDRAANYCKLNMTSCEELAKVVEDCGIVYFFTGKTGTLQGFEAPNDYLELNEGMLLRFLKVCKELQCKAKIVFPSTRLVYRGGDRPLPEEAEKQFLTPYAIQKYACEQYLEMFCRLFEVRYCIMRICVPYGTLVRPVRSYGTVDFFLRQAKETGQISIYGDGSQRRTVTYIEDLCNILWRAGLEERCINDVYNIGGEDMSVREIAESVARATGAKVVEKPWPEQARKMESGSTVFNADKLDLLLEYQAEMTVERWIRKMTQEFYKNSQWGGGTV